MNRKNKLILISSGFGLLITGIFFGIYMEDSMHKHCENSEYTLTNPSLKCIKYDHIKENKEEIDKLKYNLSSWIEDRKSSNKASTIAVFFRDLETGLTFGINEQVDFIPASLLKLPLVLTYFELAEEEQPLFEKQLTFKGYSSSTLDDQTFFPKKTMKVGESDSVENLIFKTLVYSDNASYVILYEYIKDALGKEEEIFQMYRDLGIINPYNDLTKSAVSAKGYARVFRQLFNSAILQKETSEKILKMLSQSEFKEGLKKGTPENITVAHKFGERFLVSGEKQLHDCGIVYYPKNPYVLCVMTRGNDFTELSLIIGHISKEVFNMVENRK